MNKGKTYYRFQINCNPEIINRIINEWLQENKFRFENKYGENMYFHHDAWNGNRGFQYSINNNEVGIYAWTIGVGNQFFMLDSGAVNNMAGDSYKALLSGLFGRINSANVNNNANTANIQMNNNTQAQYNAQMQNNAQAQYNAQMQNNTQAQNIAQVASNVDNEVTRNAETLCEVGFWLSIVGLILSLFGFAFGVIIYILIFCFAAQGLKTRKRTKAIVSIVLASISCVILVGMIVLGFLLQLFLA